MLPDGVSSPSSSLLPRSDSAASTVVFGKVSSAEKSFSVDCDSAVRQGLTGLSLELFPDDNASVSSPLPPPRGASAVSALLLLGVGSNSADDNLPLLLAVNQACSLSYIYSSSSF